MSEPKIQHAMRGLLLLFASCFIIYCGTGCVGTPMQRARTIVSTSAQVAVGVDRTIRVGFAAASGAAASDPETFRRYNLVVTSLLLARMAIIDAEIALDGIDAGREGEIGDVIACVVEAVQNLIALLPTLDVHIPDAVALVMSMASAFSGTCGTDHEIDTSAIPSIGEAITVVGAQ
jgi:hypothetical protein